MHVAKYKSCQIGNMITHYNRNHGEERNYSNKNINAELTPKNYNLAPDRGSEIDFINKRISEVKHLNRADVIKMADWVITLPKDYSGNEREFFEEAYHFMAERYGEKNVISAYLHFDEKSPHMHFSFIPITRTVDKDNQIIEKLSAKEVLNRQELREIHHDMERVLNRRLDCPVRLLNEATRQGNKAIAELQRETAIKDLERLNAMEKVKAVQPEPVEPIKSLRGQVIPYAEHQRVVEQYNRLLYEKQREVYAERDKVSLLCNRLDRAERDAKEEHQLRLELYDKLQDKDYLKNRIKELDRENSPTHSRDREYPER